MLKKIIISLLLIIVAGLAVAYHTRNTIVEWGVEEGSSAALGVETELGSADLGITAAYLKLNDFKISNPQPFEEKYFLTIEFGMLDINEASLFSDKVAIDSFVLDGIDIKIIHNKNGSNYAHILENIKELKSEPRESEQKFVINKISIRDISVEGSITLLNQKPVSKSLSITELTLTNVGGDDGLTLGELASEVISKIISRAVNELKDELPDEIGKQLENLDKGGLEKAGSDIIKKVKEIGGSIF